MSAGKQFEEDFKKSFKEAHKDRILRLYDTTNGFSGVANICDFIYYAYPFIGMFELKSVAGKSLPFANITDKQWQGLLDRAKLPGMVCAILIQFREYKEGYLVPIDVLQQLLETGVKSISYDKAKEYGMPLHLKYKRTRCELDAEEFMKNFIEFGRQELVEPGKDGLWEYYI